MNKWIELLAGLILVIGGILLWALTLILLGISDLRK